MKIDAGWVACVIGVVTGLLLGSGTCAAQTAMPKYETRAVWLTTIGGLDWPHTYSQTPSSQERQKQELTDMLDRLKAANINTILLQTRVRATTIYPSLYEPWDGCLSGTPGKSPGYDALQFAIDECHKRGMELHAWVVTIPIGKWNAIGCKTVRSKYPRMAKRIGNEGYVNPESPQAARYIADICREIARHYDVDGIHLDYIRYPETWTNIANRHTGRENITRIVRAASYAIRGEKPWVKISCSPIGKHDDLARYWSHGWNAYTRTCQDAQGWIAEGLVDMLFPMMYFRGDQFYPFALDWQENSHGKPVVAGLGAYMLSPSERDWELDEIKRQIAVSRSIGMGQAFFRSKFITDNTKGIYDYLQTVAYPYPALTPPTARSQDRRPDAPQGVRVEQHAAGYVITWHDNPHLYYNVYASEQSPVDTDDPRNLIATRHKGNRLVVKTSRKMHFIVKAIDRFGGESSVE